MDIFFFDKDETFGKRRGSERGGGVGEGKRGERERLLGAGNFEASSGSAASGSDTTRKQRQE